MKSTRPLLLFDSNLKDKKEEKGMFSEWMRKQKETYRTGHTLITTFNIDYEFMSKALNGLFFNRHECTILRSGFSPTTDCGDIEDRNNINIYPYRKNKKTHAKSIISLSYDSYPQYFIAFGSGNITYGGLGGNNLELIEVFSDYKGFKGAVLLSKSIKEWLIESFLPIIAKELEGRAKANINNLMESLQQIKAEGTWPKIIDNQKRSLISQMITPRRKRNSASELHILSPYHGVTKNLFVDFNKKPKWILGEKDKIIQKSKSEYDFHRLKDDDRNLHAKAYIFKQDGAYEIFYGSANCTDTALIKSFDKNRGQFEILLSRKLSKREYVDILRQYAGVRAEFEEYALKSDFREDELASGQLFCINVSTRRNNMFMEFIAADTKTGRIEKISTDQNRWVSIKHDLLNKEIPLDNKEIKKVADLLFKKENPTWVYQKIGGKIIPVPVNYEGELSYNGDKTNSIEDEIIYCLGKAQHKRKKSRKQGNKSNDIPVSSSLTHNSELDLWYKKIKIIKDMLVADKNSSRAEEMIEKLIDSHRNNVYKHSFLKWRFRVSSEQ